jgi:hypothetical protein
MPQRNVASNFTFEQQRVEINNLAQDFWTQKGIVDNAAPTYLKHDGSNAFTGQTLAVPNAFTINSNSGNGTVTIAGNLQVDGTTTTVNTATMDVVDKNITIAKGSANDAAADGAGITIDSATDITFNFVDAKDALVSSIGLEATTFIKSTRAQFTGAGNPTTGQGLELTAPDQNTGQIASYDRDTPAYKELRLKGSTVSLYTGTTNAIIGTFNSTGLTMESGKTITGVLATAAQPNITSLGTLTGLTIENALSTNGRASAHGYICRDNYGTATGIGNGMYSPGVNTLGFATNSVERLTLTGDTTYSQFILKRSATTNQNVVFYYDANYLDIETREATGIRLKTNQGDRLTIESTGEVGIGSSVPTGFKLAVNGDLSLGETSGTDNTFIDQKQNGNLEIINSGRNDNTGAIRINRMNNISGDTTYFRDVNIYDGKGSSVMYVDGSAASVGIGVTSPAYPLDVVGDGGGSFSASTDSTAGSISIVGKNSSGSVSAISRIKSEPSGNTNKSQMVFQTRNSSSTMIERMRLATNTVSGVERPVVLFGYNTGNITTSGGWTPQVQIHGTNQSGSLAVYGYNQGPEIIMAMSASGTVGTQAAVTNTNITGRLRFAAADGNNMDTVGAEILSKVTDTVSTGKVPTDLQFWTSNTTQTVTHRMSITKDGHVIPALDNSYDLGETGTRWRNIYTNDLNLSNKGSTNSVDNTWGDYTIQEGESDLFIINNRSGKKYKFNLTEVN